MATKLRVGQGQCAGKHWVLGVDFTLGRGINCADGGTGAQTGAHMNRGDGVIKKDGCVRKLCCWDWPMPAKYRR